MKIEIEIPKEFEEHFKQDKFEDTLHRLSADAHLIAGNYEQETAIMLIKAFADSKPAYDLDKVVESLEEKALGGIHGCQWIPLESAIDIVRGGGVNERI
jgi:hypothetical protein